MKASRAYLAGLGTTSVLVAGAMLLLVVVSTLMAFRGWSPADVAGEIDDLALNGDVPALELPPPVVKRDRAPATRPDNARPRRTPVRPLAPLRRRPVVAFAEQPSDAPIPPPPGDFDGGPGGLVPGAGADLSQIPTPPSSVGFTPRPASAAPPRPVADLTQGLEDAVAGVTQGLGEAVGGVSPGLGTTVAEPDQTLADILRALGLHHPPAPPR